MTSATAVVADTQILIWYVIDPSPASGPIGEAARMRYPVPERHRWRARPYRGRGRHRWR